MFLPVKLNIMYVYICIYTCYKITLCIQYMYILYIYSYRMICKILLYAENKIKRKEKYIRKQIKINSNVSQKLKLHLHFKKYNRMNRNSFSVAFVNDHMIHVYMKNL